jgi:hypothetical protein
VVFVAGVLMMTKAVKPGMVVSTGVWRDNLLVLQQNTVLTTNIIRRLADWGINAVQVKTDSYNNWGNDRHIEVIKAALTEDETDFIVQYTKAVKLTNELFESMHDIGKSQIPKAILEKPGKLTREERKTINLHPEYGYYMAKNIRGILSEVPYAILQHHERENGDGYPKKLVSSNINLSAKIVAVADVYDAMTTERIHQKSVTPFTALETLIEDMFIRLDKECCKALIRNRFVL